jgi:hypothetical protein
VQRDAETYPAHATLWRMLERPVDWDEEHEQGLADLVFLIQRRWSDG